MIADVVAWKPKDELPFDELAEATNWVISEALGPYDSETPMVFFTPITVTENKLRKMGKNWGGFGTMYFAVVVTDEPIDDDKARELYRTYMDNLEKEVNSDGNSTTGNLSPKGVEGSQLEVPFGSDHISGDDADVDPSTFGSSSVDSPVSEAREAPSMEGATVVDTGGRVRSNDGSDDAPRAEQDPQGQLDITKAALRYLDPPVVP